MPVEASGTLSRATPLESVLRSANLVSLDRRL